MAFTMAINAERNFRVRKKCAGTPTTGRTPQRIADPVGSEILRSFTSALHQAKQITAMTKTWIRATELAASMPTKLSMTPLTAKLEMKTMISSLL